MFIDCPACGSSYNVADDKVRGRRVRVRCRNCGNAILVDGRASLPPPPTPPPMPSPVLTDADRTRQLSPEDTTRAYGDFSEEEQTRVFSASQGLSPIGGFGRTAAPTPSDEWMVNLSDTDQQRMTTDAIVDAYNAGLLPDDAYVWKDGMADWRLVADVAELRDALNDAGHTRVVESEFIAEPEYITEPKPAPPPVAYAPPAAPPPSSAGRAARAPGPPSARDLFGSVEVAGSESELLSSQSETSLERYDQKPTGARGDSSVLFSMDAFRRGETGPGRPPPVVERADAVFDMGPSAGPSLPTDAALLTAAPPSAPPPPPPSAQARTRDTTPPAAPTEQRPSGTLLYVLGGVVGLVLIMGTVWFFVLRPKSVTSAAEPPVASALASSTPAPAPEKAPKKDEEPEPKKEELAEEPEEPEEPETESDEAEEEAPQTSAPAPRAAPRPASGPSPTPSPSPTPKAAPEPEPKSEEPSPSLMEAMKGDVPKVTLEEDVAAPEKEKSDAPPFNMGAAKAALSAASAGSTACKTADGPTGSGKVQVTFATSGRVTSANIIDGPFPGTSVGGCVAKKFRAARVPAFSGESVTVAKSFRIPD